MYPLFFKLGDLSLIILPDTQAHLNGHAVITHTYSLFDYRHEDNASLMEERKSKLHLINNHDPDYYGLITFELPDKLFNYTAGGIRSLESDRVEQIIEFLSDIRNNPNLWKNSQL